MIIAVLLVTTVAAAAVVNGTSGDDVLEGTSNPDTLNGYDGNDILYGYGGDDVLWSGPGSDVSRGDNHNDTIHGEGGNDKLYGADGNDELRGGDGSDSLTGNAGDDRFYDRGDAHVDEFYCGLGNDTVYAESNDFVATTCETVNASGELLPDLSMKTPREFRIQNTLDGKRLLRFATIIVNLGPGPFELSGQRPNTGTADMSVTQHIYDSTGGHRDRSTTATAFYAGDGHEHWHVRDLEEYELLSNGSQKLRSGAKQGFCFYDNWKNFKDPSAATDPYYLGCAEKDPNALNLTMGLSRGWGDRYAPKLFGQYIDITGLSNGKYRVKVSADMPNWFLESDETNNVSWVDLQINADDTVVVLAYGPNAPTVR